AVEADRDAKSYGEENTFGSDVRDDRTIREAIIAHGEAVARRLRRDGVRARTVVVKIKLAERLGAGKYRLLTRQASLATASDDGDALTAVALALWDRHRPRRAVRLIGVAATGIEDGAQRQLALFDDPRCAARVRLNAALDRLVARFGEASIGRAVGKPEKAAPTSRIKRGEAP